jgi:hypothetical protein
VSDTVATAITYQLVLADPAGPDSPFEEPAIAPIIIFAIAISSFFVGIGILVGSIYLCRRLMTRKRSTLIKTNNELHFKRGDTSQKHPLTAMNPKLQGITPGGYEGESNLHDNEVSVVKPPKLSDFLVSQENLNRIEKHQQRMANDKDYNLTVNDIRRRSEFTKPDAFVQQNSQGLIENFSKDNYEYVGGPTAGHYKKPHKNSEEDDMLSHTDSGRARNVISGNDHNTISGKTTAKVPTHDYDEERDEDESKQGD